MKIYLKIFSKPLDTLQVNCVFDDSLLVELSLLLNIIEQADNKIINKIKEIRQPPHPFNMPRLSEFLADWF